MSAIQNPNDFYLLRWRFDFQTGASRFGMWSQPGNIEQAGAWRQTKSGLHVVRAVIEGKHYVNRTTHALAECSGQEFVMFEWLAFARLNPLGLKGSTVPRTTLGGLSIVTREEIVTVMVSGEVKRAPRPDAHKKAMFATYGK